MCFAGTIQNNVCAHSSFVGSQSPRWSYLVLLFKARGGPHVYLSVCAAHQWDARDRVEHTGYNVKQMDCASAPDFQRIPTTNNLRTGMHARIKSIQIGERRSARPSKCSPDSQ